MFILVNQLFYFVTGELEQITWGTFDFMSQSTKFCVYNLHFVHLIKFKKSKKLTHEPLLFL